MKTITVRIKDDKVYTAAKKKLIDKDLTFQELLETRVIEFTKEK